MSIGSRLWGAALALSLCLPMVAHGAEVAKKDAPTPLSAYELYRIYGDKTWTWNTGGGRFFDEGRRFVAWSNDKGKPSFAEGRWVVDDLGQLCMRTLFGSRRRIATSFSLERSEILMPSTLAALASITCRQVDIASI